MSLIIYPSRLKNFIISDFVFLQSLFSGVVYIKDS